MRKLIIALIFTAPFIACKENNAKLGTVEASVQEVHNADPNVIVTEATPTDTVNVAKMSFEEEVFNFGKIDEGEMVTHVYKFTNTGKAPLAISNARSTCGCTVPTWPKEPIGVGESGEIEVNFNTKGKRKRQRKPVTITANTYPAQTVVYLEGEVTPVDLSPPTASIDKK